MRLGLALSVTLILFVGRVATAEEKFGSIPDSVWSLQPPAADSEAGAVVVFDIGATEIPTPYGDAFITIDRHVRIKVFSKDKADEAANVSIPCYDDDDLRGLKAHTILPDGKKIKVESKDIFEKKVGESYKDVTFAFPSVTDGCVLEYKYQIAHERFGMLDPWYFQSELFTLYSEFSVLLAKGLSYTTAMVNVARERWEPVVNELHTADGPINRYTWSLTNLKPIPDEPYMAARENYLAALHFQLVSYKDPFNSVTFVEGWDDLGEEVQKRYDDFVGSHDWATDSAKAWVKEAATETEKARRLFTYVQVELQSEATGAYLFPYDYDLRKMLNLKSGSKVAKNCLLLELLRGAGISAEAVLIGTRDHMRFNPNVCMLRQFDHLLVRARLDGRDYELDASDRWTPFPYLPAYSLVGGGLLLKGKESLPTTFALPHRKSSETVASRIVLRPDGSASCTTHVLVRGYLIEGYKPVLEKTADEQGVLKSFLHDRALAIKLNDFRTTAYETDDSVVFDLAFEINDFAQAMDNQLVLAPLVFDAATNPFIRKQRYFPVDFNYPFSIASTVDLMLPDGMTVATKPQDIREAMDGVRFNRVSMAAGNSARMMSQVMVEKSFIAPENYAKLRALFETASNAASEEIAIIAQ